MISMCHSSCDIESSFLIELGQPADVQRFCPGILVQLKAFRRYAECHHCLDPAGCLAFSSMASSLILIRLCPTEILSFVKADVTGVCGSGSLHGARAATWGRFAPTHN